MLVKLANIVKQHCLYSQNRSFSRLYRKAVNLNSALASFLDLLSLPTIMDKVSIGLTLWFSQTPGMLKERRLRLTESQKTFTAVSYA
jgi:hypothetical protein